MSNFILNLNITKKLMVFVVLVNSWRDVLPIAKGTALHSPIPPPPSEPTVAMPIQTGTPPWEPLGRSLLCHFQHKHLCNSAFCSVCKLSYDVGQNGKEEAGGKDVQHAPFLELSLDLWDKWTHPSLWKQCWWFQGFVLCWQQLSAICGKSSKVAPCGKRKESVEKQKKGWDEKVQGDWFESVHRGKKAGQFLLSCC